MALPRLKSVRRFSLARHFGLDEIDTCYSKFENNISFL